MNFEANEIVKGMFILMAMLNCREEVHVITLRWFGSRLNMLEDQMRTKISIVGQLKDETNPHLRFNLTLT